MAIPGERILTTLLYLLHRPLYAMDTLNSYSVLYLNCLLKTISLDGYLYFVTVQTAEPCCLYRTRNSRGNASLHR